MQMNLVLTLFSSLLLIACDPDDTQETTEPPTNIASNDRMLLVLSAPSVNDTYYAEAFDLIVDFHVRYAQQIMGNDNVVVLVDADTKPQYANRLPEDVLLTVPVQDIWMRDFTTVNPENPVQFTYTWASMPRAQSIEVQQSFSSAADRYGISRQNTELLLDGGNLVDNYTGRAVTTTRFLEDNNLSTEDGKQALRELLNLNEVAILEPDEEVLAHSDGMVSWVDDNVLFVNDYSSEPDFRQAVLDELTQSFPNAQLVEVPVQYTENPPGVWEGFSSACGVHVNAVLTYRNLYVPMFGMSHDNEALGLIRQHTSKNVIPVNARNVCAMGGSVRCLTWQLTGANANRLIEAARAD